MSKHRFSYVERYALWRAHDGRCFYCEEPLDFIEMTIDHVVPERLAGEPDELRLLRQEFEIDANFPGFQINDFSNWVPAHARGCNGRKGAEVFPKKLTLLLLQSVQRKRARVQHELDAICRERRRGHVLGSLSTAIENRHLSIDEVQELLADIESSQDADEPLVLTFGLTLEELQSNSDFPAEVSRKYPYLCDWLELDLVRHLRAILSTRFHYTEPSERWGDGLSVRIVFPRVRETELDAFDRSWWEILEAGTFFDIFGEAYANAFPYVPPHEYFGQLEGPQ